MGRGQRQQAVAATAAPRRSPAEIDDLVFEALPVGDIAPAKYLRGDTQMTSAQITRALERLERAGRVSRVFNAHGPQQPWWWRRERPAPEDIEVAPLRPGAIYDVNAVGNSYVWLKVVADGEQTVECEVYAGDHQPVKAFLPRWQFAHRWHRRNKGEVTAFSSGFLCTVHGKVTDGMVRTDKCCALCGEMLLRV